MNLISRWIALAGLVLACWGCERPSRNPQSSNSSASTAVSANAPAEWHNEQEGIETGLLKLWGEVGDKSTSGQIPVGMEEQMRSLVNWPQGADCNEWEMKFLSMKRGPSGVRVLCQSLGTPGVEYDLTITPLKTEELARKGYSHDEIEEKRAQQVQMKDCFSKLQPNDVISVSFVMDVTISVPRPSGQFAILGELTNVALTE